MFHLWIDRRIFKNAAGVDRSLTKTFTKFDLKICFACRQISGKKPVCSFGLTAEYWSLSILLDVSNNCYTLQESPNLTRTSFNLICFLEYTGMPGRENGKRRYFIYDLSTALEELRFTRAFGPGILAALFYGVVSGSMSFVNKIVLTSYTFHFPNVLMLAQVVMLSVVLEAGRLLGYSSMPKYTLERGKKFFIPSVCFALHTTLALQALDYLSIPMYNVLRRLLPLTSLLFACCMLKKKPSLLVVIAVMLVVVGCITAGFGDLEFSIYAYISALASVVCQSFYLTYIQKSGVEEGLSTVTVLFTNSVNCVPLLLIYTLCNKELFSALAFDGLHITGFQAAVVFDVSMGCILSYSLFLCTTMNSALTTSLVGVVKGLLTTIIGFYTFGGVAVTALTVLGVVLNTLGGALYSYAKYTENMAKGIQKHFHKHTIKVNPGMDPVETKKNGMIDHNHKVKNGIEPDAVITVNENDDMMVDFDNRRASMDGTLSSSESSVE